MYSILFVATSALFIVFTAGQPLPDIPSEFRVSEELTSNGVTSYIRDVVYSEAHQAIRYERRATSLDPVSFYSLDPLISIHDYNIGVSFTINKFRGNCTMSPISVLMFDTKYNWSLSLANVEDAYVMRLKSPKAFFQLDTDYTFSGQDAVNGIGANVFLSEFMKNTTAGLVKTTNAFAFSSPDIKFQQTGMTAANVPLRLKTNTENQPDASSHFYDFDQVEDLRWFDVSKCFNDIEEPGTVDFRIQFKPLSPGGFLLPDEKTLIAIAYQTLINFTKESFTRFTHPRVTFGEDGILYLRSSVLPTPPPLSYFTVLPNMWILSTPAAETTRVANNTAECAARCIANIRCLSFDYSYNTRNCFVNVKHSLDGAPSSINGVFHHSKNTLNGFYARQVFEIMDLLSIGVDKKNFTLSINGKVFEASKVEEVEENENGRFGTTQVLSRYDMRYPNNKFATVKDRLIEKVSIDDCAHACSNEAGFECKSFDFCFTSGNCRLSKSSLGTDMSEYTASSECDIYEKNALYHYIEYPSRALTNDKDIKYEPVRSPEDCASKCDSESRIHCRSFNFCPGMNMCYLSERHTIDADTSGSSNPNLNCIHYSRDYLSDYTFTSAANIALEAEIVTGDATLERCAIRCSTADGFLCTSMDFCPETKKCLLHSKSNAGSQSSSSQKDVCYNYKREYFSNSVNVPKTSDNSAVMFGLSIGLGLVAIGAGAGAAFFYLKKNGQI